MAPLNFPFDFIQTFHKYLDWPPSRKSTMVKIVNMPTKSFMAWLNFGFRRLEAMFDIVVRLLNASCILPAAVSNVRSLSDYYHGHCSWLFFAFPLSVVIIN